MQMTINRRTSPCPMTMPMTKTARPTITQNTLSATTAMRLNRIRRLTARRKSYRNPAMNPTAMAHTAWIS